MTCMHAACASPATTRCRFGDGTWRSHPIHRAAANAGRPSSSKAVHQQTFVYYCDDHMGIVDTLFRLCDVGPANGPNGPLRPRRHRGTVDSLRV